MKQLVKLFSFTLLLALSQGVVAQNFNANTSNDVHCLSVISFNIRYNSWNNIDGDNGWLNRRAAVVKMIETERPAAIGLQEALIDQLQYLDSCLTNYCRVGVGRDDGKEGGEFMAIYYDTTRLNYLGSDTWWLSETPNKPSLGWDAACRRTVTALHLCSRQSGKDFVFLNTHLDHVGKVARDSGAKLIASIVESQYYDVPVVLAGDMNSTIDDTIFQHFYDAGFLVARDIALKTSYHDTFNGFGKSKTSLIDHFFVKNVWVTEFRTLFGNYGVPYISDHYPIEIVLIDD